MNRYCAFLRGINVNGVSIQMAALRQALENMGYQDVKTVLATGNVIIALEDSVLPEAHKARIENGLAAAFSYDAHVLLRSAAEVLALLEAASGISVPEGCHLYALLIEEQEALTSLGQAFLQASRSADEQFFPLHRDAFWVVQKGETLHTEFGTKVLGSKRYKSVLTSRNINTLKKVSALMHD